MRGHAGAAPLFAFFVAFFSMGIPYWRVPYSQASLPSSLYGFGLLVVLVLPVVLELGFGVSFIRSLLAAGLGAPAMVMARVVVETFEDPTSHNLWPVEIFIASGIGLLVALPGAAVGGLVALVLRKRVANGDGDS